MSRSLCKEWILRKILRNGENFIWKYVENFGAILDKFKSNQKKFLKGRGCKFRETLQKFSENFEKIFKYKKYWYNVNVKQILVTYSRNFKNIFMKFLKSFIKIQTS